LPKGGCGHTQAWSKEAYTQGEEKITRFIEGKGKRGGWVKQAAVLEKGKTSGTQPLQTSPENTYLNPAYDEKSETWKYPEV